jgi:site-specific recombinase XerD
MTNVHSNPTPLRQKFIEHLTLNRKAERTVHTYVSFIYSLAKHCRRSPDLLGPEDIRHWLYYLIAERKQAASTVNLAINAVRSFYGGLLQRDIEPLLHQIKRPRRPARAPRLYSMAEVERLLTVGTEGNLRARAFLSCVHGGGLRLSEATHIQIKDLDGVRHRLLVSHPKGGRQRYTLLSDNLLTVLRDYYRQAHPKIFLFPGTEPLEPINKATSQNIFYGAARQGQSRPLFLQPHAPDRPAGRTGASREPPRSTSDSNQRCYGEAPVGLRWWNGGATEMAACISARKR